MSYKEDLEKNNLKLQNITNIANNLPDKIEDFNHYYVSNLEGAIRFTSLIKEFPDYNGAVCNATISFGNYFNLIKVPNLTYANLTKLNSSFSNCYNLANVPNFNIRRVTNISRAFEFCESLESINLYNTNNVTNMDNFCYDCSSLVNIDEFNTSKVTSMRASFCRCNLLSNESIQNIINMCLNSNVTNSTYKNLNTTCRYSPFYLSNITSDRYSNRLAELMTSKWAW